MSKENTNGQQTDDQNNGQVDTNGNGGVDGANTDTTTGGTGTDDNGTGTDDNADNSGASGSGEKTFTQKEVSAMMAREKKQGRNAAFNELGLNPKDKKTMAIIKAVIDSQKADDDNASGSENDELVKRAEVAEAKAEAMLSGVKKEFVEDAVTLIMAKKTEGSDLKTLFSELKTKYPVWFDSEDDESDKNNNNVGSKGTGASLGSRSDQGGSNPKGLGARLAAQKKGHSKQSSYWGNKK